MQPFDELAGFELAPGAIDARTFVVIGRGDFVFGRVRRLIACPHRREIVYLVVGTSPSNLPAPRGEERLLPVAWCELKAMRRQARVPQLGPSAFRRLPLHHPGAAPPAEIPFPLPRPDEVEFWNSPERGRARVDGR